MSAEGTPDGAPRGVSVLELVEVMDRLRSAGGCPWDAEQTHQSLVQYLLEETYEVIDAIEHGTADDLVEELGDLLLQVVFHSRIGQEESPQWDIDDVATGISAKLVRRHPHVFGSETAGSTEELEQQWHRQKVAEKNRTSVVDGIPQALPGLALSAKILSRCQSAGVVVEVNESAVAQVESALRSHPSDQLESKIGDLLLATAQYAQQRGVDPETALRNANFALQQQIRDASH